MNIFSEDCFSPPLTTTSIHLNAVETLEGVSNDSIETVEKGFSEECARIKTRHKDRLLNIYRHSFVS